MLIPPSCILIVIKAAFNKPLVMTEKDHEDFNNSTKCWICKKACEGGKVKVKDQDHVTGKYRGSAHQECNLNFILTKKFFAMFHN